MSPHAPPAVKKPRPSSGTRELMLGWCLWLLGSWAVTLWGSSPVPGVRWMLFAAMVGLLTVWPAFRLSQASPAGGTARGAGVVLADWVCLMLIFQAVIWPLRMVAAWSYEQAAWLAAAVAAWSLLVGALIALGRTTTSGAARAALMLLCVLVFVGEPALQALAGGGNWAWRISPIQLLWGLSGPAYEADPGAAPPRVLPVAVAAVGLWIGVLAWLAAGGVRPRPAATA